MNSLKKKIIFGCGVTVGMCAPQLAQAYDPSTHQLLTQSAVSRSILSAELFYTKLGLTSAQMFPIYEGTNPLTVKTGGGNSASGAATWGAWFEDMQYSEVAFNHFFDPQHNARGLTLLGAPVGEASPDWVLNASNHFWLQNWSFPKGHAQLLTALTAPQPNDRLLAFGRVFQGLGHMVHHIQDMAQPQHVRNEAHLDKGIPMAEAAYEAIAKDALTQTAIAQYIAARPYAIPVFNTARDFWQSSTGAYTGMADFTAKNFITYNTGYRYNKTTTTLTALSDYPLPNGYNPTGGTNKTRVTESISVPVRGGGQRQGVRSFIKGEIYDTYAGAPTSADDKNQYLAIISTRSLYSTDFEEYSWADTRVFQAGWSYLIPRAVAFSAGLINHFFKGDVDLVPQQNGTWLLKNLSPVQTSGAYKIYAESPSQIRIPVSEYPLTLAPGASTALTLSPPQDSTKLIVAFSGVLGGEPNTVHGRVVTIPKTASSVGLSSNPPTGVVGSPVTLTASITGSAGTPTGTVQFKEGTNALGSPMTLSASGTASYTVSSPTEGLHTYTADYSGDLKNLNNSASISVNVVKPAPPCGGTISPSGGKGTFTYPMDLGGTPGRVSISFEAYSVPDGLTIKSSRGQTLVDLPIGSGLRSPSFDFNEAALGTRFVNVTVNAPNEGTAWRLAVSCPGGSVPALPTKRVSFYVKYNTCTGAYWKYSIDGSSMSNLDAVRTLTVGQGHAIHATWYKATGGCMGAGEGSPGGVYYNDGTGERQLLGPLDTDAYFNVN